MSEHTAQQIIISGLLETAKNCAGEVQKLVKTQTMQDALSGVIADLEWVKDITVKAAVLSEAAHEIPGR